MPDGEHLIEEIDCSAVINELWIQQLNQSTADITTDVDPSLQKQLEESGKKLCSTLFPTPVMKCILKPEVKHIYIGSDLLNRFPFVLLPGLDGSPLFKNCTLSHVSSSSELLQQVISARLFALEKEQQSMSRPPYLLLRKMIKLSLQKKVSYQVPPFSHLLLKYPNISVRKHFQTVQSVTFLLILIMTSKFHSQVSHCGRHLQTYGSLQFPE